MGKGGVGKTTIAAAIAVALAHRGHAGPPDHHRPRRPPDRDPARRRRRADRVPHRPGRGHRGVPRPGHGHQGQEPRRRRARQPRRGPALPVHRGGRGLPAVLQAVAESRREFVVIDTAPTGHTLLLLDAAGSYHRDVARQMGDSDLHYTTPLMRCRTPPRPRSLLVTLAEPTPVLEARCCRTTSNAPASTPGPGSSTTPSPPPTPDHPFLRQRADAETRPDRRRRSPHRADRGNPPPRRRTHRRNAARSPRDAAPHLRRSAFAPCWWPIQYGAGIALKCSQPLAAHGPQLPTGRAV